jgi:hypothetical protein
VALDEMRRKQEDLSKRQDDQDTKLEDIKKMLTDVKGLLVKKRPLDDVEELRVASDPGATTKAGRKALPKPAVKTLAKPPKDEEEVSQEKLRVSLVWIYATNMNVLCSQQFAKVSPKLCQ